ncbi:hypothetical protein BsWGS_02587 [Bradybaena similaris]
MPKVTLQSQTKHKLHRQQESQEQTLSRSMFTVCTAAEFSKQKGNTRTKVYVHRLHSGRVQQTERKHKNQGLCSPSAQQQSSANRKKTQEPGSMFTVCTAAEFSKQKGNTRTKVSVLTGEHFQLSAVDGTRQQ